MGNLSSNISILGINTGLGVSFYSMQDNVIANLEERAVFHSPGNKQWLANFPNTPLVRDLHNPKLIGLSPDVIITSPDCGAGSILRMSRAKQSGNHKNNASLITSIKSINLFQPKVFLFENLEGLFKSFPLSEIMQSLPDHRLIVHNCSVLRFGNSQKDRKRLVIIGVRKDLDLRQMKKCFKLPREGKYIIQSSEELYGDLTEEEVSIGHVRELKSDVISIFAKKRLSIEQIQLEWRTRLIHKSRWITENGEKFSSAPGVYRNLNHRHPATARKANRQFDHDGQMLTPRQLARVMGVPDEFKIYMELEKRNYWINKSRTLITKGMVYEVGLWFKKCLIKSEYLWNNKSN